MQVNYNDRDVVFRDMYIFWYYYLVRDKWGK
jgi:hypothetical protein